MLEVQLPGARGPQTACTVRALEVRALEEWPAHFTKMLSAKETVQETTGLSMQGTCIS